MFKNSMLNTENIKQGKGVEISEQPITYFSIGQIAVALGPLDIKTECRWSHVESERSLTANLCQGLKKTY
jgi:hypothetical protein